MTFNYEINWKKARALTYAYNGFKMNKEDYINMIIIPNIQELNKKQKKKLKNIRNKINFIKQNQHLFSKKDIDIINSGKTKIKINGILKDIDIDWINYNNNNRSINFTFAPKDKYYILSSSIKFSKDKNSQNKNFSIDLSGNKNIIDCIEFRINAKELNPETLKPLYSKLPPKNKKDNGQGSIKRQYIIDVINKTIKFDPLINYHSETKSKKQNIYERSSFINYETPYTALNKILNLDIFKNNKIYKKNITFNTDINILYETINILFNILNDRIKLDSNIKQKTQKYINLINKFIENINLETTELKQIEQIKLNIIKIQDLIKNNWNEYKKNGGIEPVSEFNLHLFNKKFRKNIIGQKISSRQTTLMDRLKSDTRISINQKHLISLRPVVNKIDNNKYEYIFTQYNYIEDIPYKILSPFTTSDIYFHKFNDDKTLNKYGFSRFQIITIDDIKDFYFNIEKFKSNVFTFLEILLNLSKENNSPNFHTKTKIIYRKIYKNNGESLFNNIKTYIYKNDLNKFNKFNNYIIKHLHYGTFNNKFIYYFNYDINTIYTQPDNKSLNLWEPNFIQTKRGPYSLLDGINIIKSLNKKFNKSLLHPYPDIINNNFGGLEYIINLCNTNKCYSDELDLLINNYFTEFNNVKFNDINSYKYDTIEDIKLDFDDFPSLSNKYYFKYLKYKQKYIFLKKKLIL